MGYRSDLLITGYNKVTIPLPQIFLTKTSAFFGLSKAVVQFHWSIEAVPLLNATPTAHAIKLVVCGGGGTGKYITFSDGHDSICRDAILRNMQHQFKT